MSGTGSIAVACRQTSQTSTLELTETSSDGTTSVRQKTGLRRMYAWACPRTAESNARTAGESKGPLIIAGGFRVEKPSTGDERRSFGVDDTLSVLARGKR